MSEIDLIQRIKNLPIELKLIIFKYYEDYTKYRTNISSNQTLV